jgi:hypothetical protein
LEQRVVSSGCSYLLIRAAPSDRVTDRYSEQANLVVAAGPGGLAGNLQASRAQVRFHAGWQGGCCCCCWQGGCHQAASGL